MFIYKITNKITNKSYVGKTSDTARRFKEHLDCANNTKYNHPFYASLRKYGLDSFSFDVIANVDELIADESERSYITELNTIYPHGYNLTEGGTGGSTTHCRMWVNDGSVNRYIFKWDDIPTGFTVGRLCNFNDSAFQRDMAVRAHTAEIHKRKIENGVGRKISEAKRGKPNIHVLGDKNPAKRDDVKDKIRAAAKSRPMLTCPHCNKVGQASPGMYANHFEKCKWKS